MPDGTYQDQYTEELRETVDRYERGLRKIGEYLSSNPPRVGDASFVVEALLAK